VQEASARLACSDVAAIDDPETRLVVVTSRLCRPPAGRGGRVGATTTRWWQTSRRGRDNHVFRHPGCRGTIATSSGMSASAIRTKQWTARWSDRPAMDRFRLVTVA